MTKSSRARVVALCVGVSLILLAVSAPAEAAKKPITGKLSKPGYTVIALAKNGKAKAVQAKRGKFRIKRPARIVTLHLRNKDGTYAGPIVVGRKKHGKRAILGVKAGAKLGKVKVKSRKGYARVKRELPEKFVDTRRRARAKRGRPIGAGKFGRVRSKNTHGGAPGDPDFDGIPDPIDIDDDGDRVLDKNDNPSGARASQGAVIFNPFSRLNLTLEQTANANAAALTDADIDVALSRFSDLVMGVLPGDSAELDCGGSPNPSPPPPLIGGLSYCSIGGTGRLTAPPGGPFPDCCDADGDGYGTLTPDPGGSFGGTALNHGATSAQIGTGDLLIERVTTGGAETSVPAALQYVFATVPALVSYSDTAGNSGTVTYPVPPGSGANGFPVAAGAGGDVILNLTFWRPQRRPIPPGETGDWIDIGGLIYIVGIGYTGQSCPAESLSEADPNLAPTTSPIFYGPGAGGVTDQVADKPANPANTLTFTLNATQCLAARGMSWNSGQEQGFNLTAVAPNATDNAQQFLLFERQ